MKNSKRLFSLMLVLALIATALSAPAASAVSYWEYHSYTPAATPQPAPTATPQPAPTAAPQPAPTATPELLFAEDYTQIGDRHLRILDGRKPEIDWQSEDLTAIRTFPPATPEITPAEKLTISEIRLSAATIEQWDTVDVTAYASGGTGPYTVVFSMYPESNPSLGQRSTPPRVSLQSLASGYSRSLQGAAAGQYFCDVTITDSGNPVQTVTKTSPAVTVAPKPDDYFGVTLNKTETTLEAGKTETLTAAITPATAKQAVTWRSGDTTVATVSSSGVVTAKKAGTAAITATYVGSKSNATCMVTVTAPKKAVLLGDVDGSGKVDESDVKLLQQYTIGLAASLPNPDAADLNKDGEIGLADYAKLREMAPRPEILLGDVDGDGVLTDKDAELILKISAGIKVSAANPDAADYNQDGKVTAADASKVLDVWAKNNPIRDLKINAPAQFTANAAAASTLEITFSGHGIDRAEFSTSEGIHAEFIEIDWSSSPCKAKIAVTAKKGAKSGRLTFVLRNNDKGNIKEQTVSITVEEAAMPEIKQIKLSKAAVKVHEHVEIITELKSHGTFNAKYRVFDSSGNTIASAENGFSNTNGFSFGMSFDSAGTYFVESTVINEQGNSAKAKSPAITVSDDSKIQKMINFAVGEEGKTNGGKYFSELGKSNGGAWCAVFVGWAAQKAGVPSSVIPVMTQTWCGGSDSNGMKPWFTKRGLWQNRGYAPKAGDIIFWDWDDNGNGPDHVGIVTGYDSSRKMVKAVHGNYSGKVVVNEWGLNDYRIDGYGTPAY